MDTTFVRSPAWIGHADGIRRGAAGVRVVGLLLSKHSGLAALAQPLARCVGGIGKLANTAKASSENHRG